MKIIKKLTIVSTIAILLMMISDCSYNQISFATDDDTPYIELVRDSTETLYPNTEITINAKMKNHQIDVSTLGAGVFTAEVEYDKDVFEEITKDSIELVQETYKDLICTYQDNVITTEFPGNKDSIIIRLNLKIKQALFHTKPITSTITLKNISFMDDKGLKYIEDTKIEFNIFTIAMSLLQKYKLIDETYIAQINANTTINKFKERIPYNDRVLIYEGSKACTGEDLMKTGMTVKVFDNEYSVVVTGDINGDGKITALELSKLKTHIINLKKLTGRDFLVMDTNFDGEITAMDLAGVKQLIAGRNY